MAPADTEAAVETVRALLREYAASLAPVIPPCRLAGEIAGLPGRYGSPGGALLLALDAGDQAAGCVGVGPLDTPGACELKRLYVRPDARGTGTGRALAIAAISWAERAGYAEMLLDTMPDMAGAQALYRALGFAEVGAYAETSIPGLLFFRKALR